MEKSPPRSYKKQQKKKNFKQITKKLKKHQKKPNISLEQNS